MKTFWGKIERVEEYLDKYCVENKFEDILDIGPGNTPFKNSTRMVDINGDYGINIDIDYEPLPERVVEKEKTFVYSRHTLEDIQNPEYLLRQLKDYSSNGYIETPSPLVELTRGVDGGDISSLYKGYHHHRYIIWTTKEDNCLHVLPKFPIIESVPVDLQIQFYHLLQQDSIWWNNYYSWDENRPLNYKVYRHLVNYNITTEYVRLLNEAVAKSIEHTDYFRKLL